MNQLALRQGAVGVTLGDGSDLRLGLVGLEPDGTLLLQQPLRPEHAQALLAMPEAAVLVADASESVRLEGLCELGGLTRFRLNAKRELTVVRLREPREVRSVQRRGDFRQEVSPGDGPMPVHLYSLGKTPLQVDGELADVSGGGFRVTAELPRELLDHLTEHRDWRAEVVIESQRETEVLIVRVRLAHLRAGGAGGRRLFSLGFQVEEEDPARQRTANDQLRRLTRRAPTPPTASPAEDGMKADRWLGSINARGSPLRESPRSFVRWRCLC